VKHLSGAPLALPTNIRLSWKGLPRTNALAYFEKSQHFTTISNEFLKQARVFVFGMPFQPVANVIKRFFVDVITLLSA
jgi:hypothetical protein